MDRQDPGVHPVGWMRVGRTDRASANDTRKHVEHDDIVNSVSLCHSNRAWQPNRSEPIILQSIVLGLIILQSIILWLTSLQSIFICLVVLQLIVFNRLFGRSIVFLVVCCLFDHSSIDLWWIIDWLSFGQLFSVSHYLVDCSLVDCPSIHCSYVDHSIVFQWIRFISIDLWSVIFRSIVWSICWVWPDCPVCFFVFLFAWPSFNLCCVITTFRFRIFLRVHYCKERSY